jgi:ketosteroid isomerase-like protein
MHEQEQNEQTVRELYADYKRGDIRALLDRLTEDVVWEVPAPPFVPGAGRHFGRDAVAEYFRVSGEAADVRTFEPRHFLAEGDRVAAVGSRSARVKETGREYVTDFVMVFKMRAGKVAGSREYMDTLAVGAAFDTGQDKLAGQSATPSSNTPVAGPHTSTYRNR